MQTITQETNYNVEELVQKWEALTNENPKLRIRNAADELGVKEVQLLATKVGKTAVRLEGDWIEFLKATPSLGRVMSLTRNDACVLEHKGDFEKVEGNPHAVTVIGPIELRTFTTNWGSGFAVDETVKERRLTSFQFFDKFGDAVLKIYLQPESNRDAFESLTTLYTAKDQSNVQLVEEFKQPEYVKGINVDAFLSDWSKLKHTHGFFGMLRKHNIARLDAMKVADGKYTKPIAKDKIESLLNYVSENQIPVMIFAGNRGNIQIHQDFVKKIVKMGPWINVLDKDFNMHLNLDIVETAWIVKKPTADGEITSIEMYDKSGELVVQFFGLRKFGETELETWRTALDKIQ